MKNRIERGLYWERAWQLVNGCTKVSSGCLNCWSERESAMRIHNPNEKISSRYEGLLDCSGKFNGKIRLRYDNLDLPKIIKKPTTFCIWNDLFHENVPWNFIYDAFIYMASCHYHKFMILTKRAERMKNVIDDIYFHIKRNYSQSLPLNNVWLGVTAENQEQADKRIPILLQTPAAVRFVSVEPMLGKINLMPYMNRKKPRLDWVLCGEESGHKARRIDHDNIIYLINQCEATKTPLFLKQAWINDKLVKMPKLGGQIWDQFPF